VDFFNLDKKLAGTKGLVFIGNEILVYRRDANAPTYPLYIDVPGGQAEKGETPYETFKREVKEEFGLEIQKTDIVYSKLYKSINQPDMHGWFAVAKLPAEMRSKIIFGDEGLEYMLVSLDQFLMSKDAWPVYKKRASDYKAAISD